MATAVTPAKIAQTSTDTSMAVREAAWEAAKRYAGKSRAENTWRGYRSAWARFEQWCERVQMMPLPATPDAVALFIAAEADRGLATATLEHRLAAIRLVHLGAGHASPHNALAVLEVVRGIRRERRGQARFKRQPAAPAIDSQLRSMVDTLGTTALRDLRDRALLLYGFATALRGTELVRLSVADIEAREKGDIVTIQFSKGDQEGAGQKVAALATPGSAYCPVRALRQWLKAANITEGPLFRRIYAGDVIGDDALTDKTVVRLIKRTAENAGLDASRYSGHSLRRGFLTSAAMAGADVLKMVAQSRHADINTILSYVDDQALFDNHAGERLLHDDQTTAEKQTVMNDDGRLTLKHIREIANAWRSEQHQVEQRTGGIVLIWRGEVTGWKNALRNPESDRPGALAVDSTGAIWEAMGGNDHDGGTAWVRLGSSE